MSSNIEVQRICQHCGNEFTARTTVTRYCSHRCSSLAHKARIRSSKVAVSNAETTRVRLQPLENLKAKEYLTVRDTATLLGCSVRTVYNRINEGKLKAGNLSKRLTRIKRSDLERFFENTMNSNL